MVAPRISQYLRHVPMKSHLPKAAALKSGQPRSDVECLGIICAGLMLACLLLGLRIISIW